MAVGTPRSFLHYTFHHSAASAAPPLLPAALCRVESRGDRLRRHPSSSPAPAAAAGTSRVAAGSGCALRSLVSGAPSGPLNTQSNEVADVQMHCTRTFAARRPARLPGPNGNRDARFLAPSPAASHPRLPPARAPLLPTRAQARRGPRLLSARQPPHATAIRRDALGGPPRPCAPRAARPGPPGPIRPGDRSREWACRGGGGAGSAAMAAEAAGIGGGERGAGGAARLRAPPPGLGPGAERAAGFGAESRTAEEGSPLGEGRPPPPLYRAVTRFWDLLTEFCVLNAAPDSWQHIVVASHPFFVWNNSWVVLRALP